MSLLILGLCGQSVFLRVPHFHRPEETLHATDLFTEPGGKGYNQAVAAARMGAQVVFAGAVGHDADGDACEKRLIDEQITPCMVRKEGRTAYAAILTDEAGENRVTVFAGVQLHAADVSALSPQFDAARMLLITPEIPEDAFARAMDMAGERGIPVVINPAPFKPWVKKYLPRAFCLTPNRSEACEMLSCTPDALENRISGATYPRMIVTLGKSGALCAQNGVISLITAPPIQPLDTTGAGDCLSGVLCSRLLAGDSLEEAAKTGVAAASVSVTRAHVLDAMPFAAEILPLR